MDLHGMQERMLHLNNWQKKAGCKPAKQRDTTKKRNGQIKR